MRIVGKKKIVDYYSDHAILKFLISEPVTPNSNK